MDKLDRVMAGLQPALLDRLAEDGYVRHRHDDLARMAAERHRAPSPWVASQLNACRGRWPVLAGGVVAVGAAAAVAVTVALPAGKPTSPAPSAGAPGSSAGAPGSSAAAPGASAVLLTSATKVARSPAATGTYWYVKERDYEPAIAVSRGHLKKRQPMSFGATFAATEESWTSQARARTIVNQDLVFTFASAADKARWVAAGRPALSTAAGFGVTRPVTSDYSMTVHWGVGRYQLSLAGMQKLPVTQGELGKILRKWWVSEPDKAGAVGFPNPSYAQYLIQWADVLLTGPARPGTRAAMYQLLAKQPGLKLIPGVTDPLGRTGVAIGDGGGDYLVIQPRTGELLAYVSHPVRANSAMPASAGLSEYQASGWTSQLGVAP